MLSKAWYTGISWGNHSRARPHYQEIKATLHHRSLSDPWGSSMWLQSATTYYHCIMIFKLWAFWADSPQIKHTQATLHPKASLLKAQDHYICKLHFSSTYEFIQLMKARARSVTFKQKQQEPSNISKGMNHIHGQLVSVHFIVDTFWPSCGSTICLQCHTQVIPPDMDIPIPVLCGSEGGSAGQKTWLKCAKVSDVGSEIKI